MDVNEIRIKLLRKEDCTVGHVYLNVATLLNDQGQVSVGPAQLEVLNTADGLWYNVAIVAPDIMPGGVIMPSEKKIIQ